MARQASAQQQIPRPKQWEVPQIQTFADFWTARHGLRDSISDQFQHALLQFQAAERRPYINFLRFIPDFEGLAEWEPRRMLGQGAFGLAGFWNRKDAHGVTIDEMVVKRVPGDKQDRGMCYRDQFGIYRVSLLSEAVIQKLVNEHQCSNVVHLRGYKYVTNDPPPVGGARVPRADTNCEARFYMEFAPYGSLERLKRKYRAWSQFLPEAFLWHLFECLVQAALAMVTQPNDQIILNAQRKWNLNSEVVHFDIKPDNIFLGYETPMDGYTAGGGENLPYPIVQLGDLGIAEVTHPQDRRNPYRFWEFGTRYYQAPEMIHYGVGFNNPPNGRFRPATARNGQRVDLVSAEENDPDPGFKFLSENNVWCIGKVMYDLATLSNSSTFEANWDFEEVTYNANDDHVIPDFQQDPFNWSTEDFLGTNPYSFLLMDTIGKCLVPSIDNRISLQDLNALVSREVSTLDHDDQHADSNYPQGSVKRRRLYYAGNDINDMPLGSANFPPSDNEYAGLAMDWNEDPAWRTLRPPPAKWRRQIRNSVRRPVDTRNRFLVRQGRIWFANAPPPAPGGLRRSARIRARNQNQNQNQHGN